MNKSIIKLIETAQSAEAISIVERMLAYKLRDAITEQKSFVIREAYGSLSENYGVDEQPQFINPSDNQYSAFFQNALKKFGVSGPQDFRDEATKAQFFAYVDANWKAQDAVQGMSSPVGTTTEVGTQTQLPPTSPLPQAPGGSDPSLATMAGSGPNGRMGPGDPSLNGMSSSASPALPPAAPTPAMASPMPPTGSQGSPQAISWTLTLTPQATSLPPPILGNDEDPDLEIGDEDQPDVDPKDPNFNDEPDDEKTSTGEPDEDGDDDDIHNDPNRAPHSYDDDDDDDDDDQDSDSSSKTPPKASSTTSPRKPPTDDESDDDESDDDEDDEDDPFDDDDSYSVNSDDFGNSGVGGGDSDEDAGGSNTDDDEDGIDDSEDPDLEIGDEDDSDDDEDDEDDSDDDDSKYVDDDSDDEKILPVKEDFGFRIDNAADARFMVESREQAIDSGNPDLQKKVERINTELRQVKQNRNKTLSGLRKHRSVLLSDSTMTPEQKIRVKKHIAKMGQDARNYFKHYAAKLKSLHLHTGKF